MLKTQQTWSEWLLDKAYSIERSSGRQLITLNRKLLEMPWLLVYFLPRIAAEKFRQPESLEEHCSNVEHAVNLTILELEVVVQKDKAMVKKLENIFPGHCDIVKLFYQECVNKYVDPQKTVVQSALAGNVRSGMALVDLFRPVYNLCMNYCNPRKFTSDNLEIWQNIITIGDTLDDAKEKICRFYDDRNKEISDLWSRQYIELARYFGYMEPSNDKFFSVLDIIKEAVKMMEQQRSYMPRAIIEFIDDKIKELNGWKGGSCTRLTQEIVTSTISTASTIVSEIITQVTNSTATTFSDIRNITSDITTPNPATTDDTTSGHDYSKYVFYLVIAFLCIVFVYKIGRDMYRQKQYCTTLCPQISLRNSENNNVVTQGKYPLTQLSSTSTVDPLVEQELT